MRRLIFIIFLLVLGHTVDSSRPLGLEGIDQALQAAQGIEEDEVDAAVEVRIKDQGSSPPNLEANIFSRKDLKRP